MDAHADTRIKKSHTNKSQSGKPEASRFAEVAPFVVYNHYLSIPAPLVNNMS